MLNPIIFDFVVNILQKLVYFRLLDVMPPTNLEYFYIIFSDTTNINFGSLESEIGGSSPKSDTGTNKNKSESDQEENKVGTKLDKYLGLSINDQTPSQKFKELDFNALSIKMTLLPFLVIIFVYVVGLIVQTFKIKNSKKYFDKEKQ